MGKNLLHLNICIYVYMYMKNSNEKETAGQFAEQFKVLSHPLRIHLMLFLDKNKTREVSVGEISEHLQISQPETSRHLVMMKNAGLLKRKKQKTNTYYYPDYGNFWLNCMMDCISRKNNTGKKI